jgi:hypothetical protein
MTKSMSDQGDRNGFQQGWEDGMKRRPANPYPSLAFGLFDTDYLRSYRAAYKDGFETAQGELARREYLLRSRSSVGPRDLENNMDERGYDHER